MTFTQFRLSAKEFFIKNENTLRFGEALMVYLQGVSPYHYKNIPDYANPFYDDTKVDEFFNYLSQKWYDAF